MKFKLIMTAVLVFGVLLVSSCSGSALSLNVKVTCEQFEKVSSDFANEFNLYKGDNIKAELCTDQAAGYSWDYTIDDESVMEFVSHEYLSESGEDQWIFKAIDVGTAEIVLKYSKSGSAVERTYTMYVDSQKRP